MYWLRLIAIAGVLILTGCASQQDIKAMRDSVGHQERQLGLQKAKLDEQTNQLHVLQQEKQEMVKEIASLRWDMELLRQASKSQSLPTRTSTTEAASAQPVAAPIAITKTLAPKDDAGRIKLRPKEAIWFDLFGRNIETKLDTKINSSRIYASDIQIFERDGRQWVRFVLAPKSVIDMENSKNLPAYESPLIRRAKTRIKGVELSESRPVVKLKLKLDDLVDETEFLLIQAKTHELPVVLGQSFLRDVATVDTSRKQVKK